MVDFPERISDLRTEDESHPPRIQVSEAVRIVEVSDEDPEHAFTLNEAALEKVLLDRKYADKKVAVIGVAGAYRKGKSFLLNFFLRYLQALEQNKDHEWLQPDAPLKGFSWRGGSERETNGILIWERPFLIRDQNGEEIAVLLMDTQGAFDSQSTVKDCATIFALSTMISSIQIYNLTQNIQEDDLQHLQLFTEYGRLALEGSTTKPFQSLIFLVRDWSFPYEAEYGFQGGQRTLDKRLQLSDKQHPELQQLRKHIRSCFDKIECFLMPHPGLKVATNPNFDGKLTDIQLEFQQALQAMIPRLLDGAHLVIKDIAGHKVTCRELVEYFKAYMKIFQGQELPEPKSMLIATAEANNLAAVSSARALYIKNMEEICGGEKPYMQTAELANEHERCRSEAIREFRNAKKMGGADFSITFLERLETDINESYESFKKSNEGKNLFKSMRTPAVLIAIMIADYVLQEFCQLLGMNSIAGIFSSVFLVIVCTLSVWAYSRYSGNLREPAGYIDDSVNWVWKEFISPNAHHMGALGGAVQLGDQLQNAAASARRAAPSASRERKDR
ncbi:unnamed protein product, partial [Mesorhabditis belari]|uniref:GB1/RHD3-type G domain-containing protein n=1 Tax=Mesorhabditis belari TaxID=2138241 RepID=A0AAF3FBU7_9BILA